MRNITLSSSLVFLILSIAIPTRAQNVWNSSSFKLTNDIAALESMTGATPVAILNLAPYATDTISFPGNFNFQFGLTSYRQFSISAYGWIKLGGKITQQFFNSETNIIVPMSNNINRLTCSYRLMGTAPARRMIIEWTGTFLGGNQPVKTQLWLYEETGKIAFVNQNMNAFTGAFTYYSFCKTTVSGIAAIAQIDVQVPPAVPLVSYATTLLNNSEAIPPNTRYLFEPDTTKPAAPAIEFSNVLPGCLTSSVRDQSVSESFFYVERRASNNQYAFIANHYSTAVAGTGNLYSSNITKLKPDSIYRFRAYASNGFRNSDTVYADIHTPMPLINGVKAIPGDYPTINALLLDAECKHLGPDLVIELQQNYSFAAEGGMVNFKPVVGSNRINSVTIRPAANVSGLVLTNAAGNYPMFLMDSVQNVHIDGRPGGLGNTSQLTITQGNLYYPAVGFIGSSNGAGLHYINFDGKSQQPAYGMIYLGRQNPAVYGLQSEGPINNALINNCKFGPAAGVTLRALVMERGNNNTVRENEFFRYTYEAIYSNEAGDNNKFIKNRFYQPEAIPFGSSADKAVMQFMDVYHRLLIDSNRIGGSSAAWGTGAYKKVVNTNFYALIKTQTVAGADAQEAPVISNNEFGNIQLTGNYFASMIDAQGNSVITHNKMGTSDSARSITAQYINIGIYANRGNSSTITDNFFGGFSCDNEMLFMSCYTLKNAVIRNNDIGGSHNYAANSGANRITGIELLAVNNSTIVNNEVHGFNSPNGSALGILQEWNAATPTLLYGKADSNKVHHLDGRRSVMGIFMRYNTEKKSTISNNSIYGLRGWGPSTFTGADNPTMITGIGSYAREIVANVPSRDTGYVTISGNKIFGFEHITPSYAYLYPVTGISTEGLDFRINNNSISLGTTMSAANSDSLEQKTTGINVYSAQKAYVEHNSIYIGGKGNWGDIGIDFQARNYPSGQKDYFISNNIIQIDSEGNNLEDNAYLSGGSGGIQNVVSNNNIWYSSNDAGIAAKLAVKRASGLDSLSFIAAPNFINPAGDSATIDLHLQSPTPADSAGTPAVMAVEKDMDGQVRNEYSPADIGADAISPCALAGNTGIVINPGQRLIEVCSGSTLTLTATLNGSFISLQWQKNLNDIPGANNATYNATGSGSYRLVGKTACGPIASNSVFIHENINPPFIKLNAVYSGFLCSGTPVEMLVEHNHNTLTTLEFKWYRNDVIIPGLTTDHEWISLNNNDIIKATITNVTPCGTTTVSSQLSFNSVNTSVRPDITVNSFEDTLYSLTNTDTVHFSITDPGSGQRKVIYVTPVAQPFHSFVNDSTLVFTNIPYSFRFKLAMVLESTCYFSDTTAAQTIYVTNSLVPKTYTFTGNGNFSDAANWVNNEVPPSPLPFNATVIINPAGTCILNVPYTVGYGGQFTVMPGAVIIIQGNLQIE